MNSKISHSGVIDSIAGNNVRVRILQTSACASCKVAGYCNASESREKMIDVHCADNSGYRTGQTVVVTASRRVADQALLLCFGVPSLLLLATLVMVLWLKGSEGVAALSALGVLLLYYLLLWLLRDSIGRRVSFQIE